MTSPTSITSVFEAYERKIYKFRFRVELTVTELVGGIPSNPDVAESWLRTKLGDETTDEQIRDEVARVMAARGVEMLAATPDDVAAATAQVKKDRHLSGFKRDFATDLARIVQNRHVDERVRAAKKARPASTDAELTAVSAEARAFAERTIGELYIEGRQVKAMLKEAANIAVGAGNIKAKGWGETRKGLLAYLSEHVFVPESKIFLAVTEPTRIQQSFVHTWRGAGIKLEEIIDMAVLEFQVRADHDFTEDEWATIMVTAQHNGLGASRSQGFGTFKVTKWEPVVVRVPRKVAAKTAPSTVDTATD